MEDWRKNGGSERKLKEKRTSKLRIVKKKENEAA